MRRRSRITLTLAGSALLVLGIGGFVFGPLISAMVPLTRSARFPLGDADSADTDAAGRVYVTDGFYKRVQRFSPAGDFELGWHIVGAVGPFRLRTGPDSTIEVAAAKARSVFVYSADGEFLTRRPLEVPFEQFASATEPRHVVRNSLSFRRRIVRVSDGEPFIMDGVPLALVRGPFPAWAFGFAGMVLLIVAQRGRRSGRAHSPAAGADRGGGILRLPSSVGRAPSRPPLKGIAFFGRRRPWRAR